MPSIDDVDLVVIGAGAGGLAAARMALSLGLTVTVLEAKDRIGGRAFTDTSQLGVPWDCGAHWLHDADNNFYAAYATEAGFTFDNRPPHFHLWSGGGWADDQTKAERSAYFDEAFAAIQTAGKAGLDIPASEAVPPHPRFQTMFESWYAAISGVEPDRTSALDDYRYRNGTNWRVRPGYGALVARYGKDLPVALSTPADRIEWGGKEVVVETARGKLRCRAVIVTASTNALGAGAVGFDPPLPEAVRYAIESVPLGEAEKIAFAFDREAIDLPPNSHVHIEHATPEALRFHIKPLGANIAVGYIAGRFAAELEARGAKEMIAFAEDWLAEIFGTGIRASISARTATHWTSDPHIRGGYSCTLPGRADQREVLLQPVGGRIFFAGEACSLTAYGAVHGAHASGAGTARRVAAKLGRKTGKPV